MKRQPLASNAPSSPQTMPSPNQRQHSVIILTVEDPQDGQEQVDDIQIQANGSGNLLLDVVVAQHHLRIDKYVPAEDEGADAAEDELGGARVWQEGVHEAEEHHGPERAVQVRHPGGKVVF